ncbi:hypothetical protein D9M71_581640 [compost metagenome]
MRAAACLAIGSMVATNSSALLKAFLPGANGGWEMLRPRMRIEVSGAAYVRAGTQSPFTTSLPRMPEVSICLLAPAASADADGTIPAKRRSVSLLGSARRRWLSSAMSLCPAVVLASPALLSAAALRVAHSGRWAGSTWATVVLVGVAACVLLLDSWRMSTSCRPIPPPCWDRLTDNCWSYIC